MKTLYSILALSLLISLPGAAFAKDPDKATDAGAVHSADNCGTSCYSQTNTRNLSDNPATYDPALIKTFTDSICNGAPGTEAPAAFGVREIQI